MLLIAVAALGAAALTLGFLALRGGSSPILAAASPAVTSAAPMPTGEAVPATSETETWSTDNRTFWLGYRSGAAFQLLSENTVHTWFGPSQPILVVRCVSHTTEALVYIRSASRIEPHMEGKTVRVQIDDGPLETDRWLDSDDHVTLFAPDGAAFARRLLGATTLRFGYSPHNADDVVAQFHVAGLGKRIAPVAATCGWKK